MPKQPSKPSKSSIYTRGGDAGHTSTLTSRIPKSSDLISLIGRIDCLNASFGLVAVSLTSACSSDNASNDSHSSSIPHRIKQIQDQLFCLGAALAATDEQDAKPAYTQALQSFVTLLESDIDRIDSSLPPLRNFILPGGNEASARLHAARCDTRRAEQLLWNTIPAQSQWHVFLNRLSDWCFVAARKIAHDAGVPEMIWTQPK